MIIVKSIEADGVTHELTFKFGTMCQAERQLGKPLPDVFSGGMGFDTISVVFWAALGGKMSIDESNDLIDRAGVSKVLPVVSEGIADYFGSGSGGE